MGSMVDQMDETSNPYFYANIKNEEAIIWNSRRNLLREIMTKFDLLNILMNGGILVMVINYGLGKIKKQMPLWKNLNSIDFHLVNLIYNFHLEYL